MKQYLNLVEYVLNLGVHKNGRNGGTLSAFGYTYKHDLEDGFPLLTTKKMFWRGIVEELVWYLSGQPHVRDLQAKGITIWDEWADERGYVPSPYGWFWRKWGTNDPCHGYDGHIASVDRRSRGGPPEGIDQLANILHELKTDPHSRRMCLTAWDPVNAWSSGLPPCHAFVVFNVQEGRLCAHLTQRSADIALGVPFNIACYSALIHLLAHISGLKPGVFSHTLVDAHIYSNHIDGMLEQVSRKPGILPRLQIADGVSDLDKVTAADFILTDYVSNPTIRFEVSP